MTPAALKSARASLGLSAAGFARAVGVAHGRTVQKWEAGDRKIPGPVALLVQHLLDVAQKVAPPPATRRA